MNILHLSNTPLSNAPSNLAAAQRACGHSTILLLDRQQNKNKVFVGGDLWKTVPQARLTELFESAHVIHFHNYAWTQNIFAAHPHLAQVARKKKCLIQYHSPRGRTPESAAYFPNAEQEGFEDTISDPFFKGRRAVVAQYQVRQYPEAEFIVPNVVPIWDDRYRPIPRPWGMPVISFAPSNINLRGWDDKGYQDVKPLLEQIARIGGAQVDIITNTPYEETLLRKKNSTIGLEEIVTGSYHLSFLEYMSLGCATIGNLDWKTKQAMGRVIGEESVALLPHVQANLQGLKLELIHLLNNPEETKAVAIACRDWMEKYWAPESHVKYFDSIYDKI